MRDLTDGMETKRSKTDYHCSECGRSYYTEDGLEIHRERIHG